MPSSPSSAAQPPLQPPFSSVLVDTANATDDELLHLIENARAAVERARDATESFTGRRREDQVEEEPSDAAAESLFERHSNRRDMELDWDERDTERRARNLLDRLQRNPPAEPLGEPDSEEEDDELMMGNERYPVGEVHHIGGRVAGGTLSAGDMFGLPTFGGIIEGSDEDDDDDSYVETGEEAIFGFDGDGVDEELEEAAWRYEEEMRRYEDSSSTDSTAPRLTSIWPGLLGEQPLNPSRPAAPPVVTSASKPFNTLPPLDPSSSTSFTSFLTPGATFIGEQVTSRAGNPRAQAERNRIRNPPPSSRLRRPLAPGELDSAGSNAQSTTAHPAFAPFPTLSTSQPSPPSQGLSASSPSSSAFHRSADPAQAFLLGPLRPTSSSSSSNPTNPANDRTSSSRYAPYSSSHAAIVVPPSSSSASTPLQAPIPPNLTPVERARISIARSTNPAARTNPESWREVGRELMGRSRGDGLTNEGSATSGRVGPGLADERWGVQVCHIKLHRYCRHEADSFTFVHSGRHPFLRSFCCLSHGSHERLRDSIDSSKPLDSSSSRHDFLLSNDSPTSQVWSIPLAFSDWIRRKLGRRIESQSEYRSGIMDSIGTVQRGYKE